MPTTRGFTLSPLRDGTFRGPAYSGIRIVGLQAAIAKLNMVDQVAHRDLGLIMYRAAKSIEVKAKAYAPVDTGLLKRSIHMEKKGPYVYQVVATTEASGREYAAHQEFGWTDRGGTFHAGVGYMRRATSEANAEARRALAALAMKLERL